MEAAVQPMNRTFAGHPPGLVVLFFAEACERFSYYGMRALLIFYLIQEFLFSDSQAYGLLAAYGAMVYFMPVIGGYIADQFIGFKRAVVFGAILLCIGHGLMAVERQFVSAAVAEQSLFFALAFIVMGVGFLKSSISNMVGQLYGPEDSRRDQGFTIFYMGINLGAFVASLACGYIGTNWGWAYGFGLAGVLMVVGLGVFLLGSNALRGIGEPEHTERLKKRLWSIPIPVFVYAGGIAMVVLVRYLLQEDFIVQIMLWVITGVATIGLLIWVGKTHREELGRTFGVFVLIGVSVVFWALFEQFFLSVKLFVDRNVILDIGLWFTPEAAQVESLNPLFIIFFAPFTAMLWQKLAKHGLDPSTPMKFAIALLLSGGSLLLLMAASYDANEAAQISLYWVVAAFWIITVGELCLSPIGLSMVTRFSIPAIMGVMMGVWFLGSSVGTLLSGELARLSSVDQTDGGGIDPMVSLAIYQEAFTIYGIIGIVAGVALLVFVPKLKKLLRLNHTVAGE